MAKVVGCEVVINLESCIEVQMLHMLNEFTTEMNTLPQGSLVHEPNS